MTRLKAFHGRAPEYISELLNFLLSKKASKISWVWPAECSRVSVRDEEGWSICYTCTEAVGQSHCSFQAAGTVCALNAAYMNMSTIIHSFVWETTRWYIYINRFTCQAFFYYHCWFVDYFQVLEETVEVCYTFGAPGGQSVPPWLIAYFLCAHLSFFLFKWRI